MTIPNVLFWLTHANFSTKRTVNSYRVEWDDWNTVLTDRTTKSYGVHGWTTKEEMNIRWASGREEKLPAVNFRKVDDVLEVGGYVFLLSESGLFFRPGTIASSLGEWDTSAWSSPQLYAFFRQYAKEHVVEEKDDEKRSFRVESIDPVTFQIIMTFRGYRASTPKHVVFSAVGIPPRAWEFDEEATRELLMKE